MRDKSMIQTIPIELIETATVILSETLDSKVTMTPIDKNTLLHQMGEFSAQMIGGENFHMAEIPNAGYMIQFDKDGSTEVHHVDQNLQGGYSGKGGNVLPMLSAMRNHIQSLVDQGKDVKISAHSTVAKHFHAITKRLIGKTNGYEMSEPEKEIHPITNDTMLSWHIKKSA